MNRDFAGLVALLPGVVDNPGTRRGAGLLRRRILQRQGGRSNGNSITIDGGSIENSNGGNGNNFVSMDSVQTVRIVTSNYQAEFGRKPGASIMAVTKGGAQQFHGAAYWYYRHEWMNANQFFNNRRAWRRRRGACRRPASTSAVRSSSPAYSTRSKSKLFFFTSLEFIRERRPQAIRNLTVPTAPNARATSARSIEHQRQAPSSSTIRCNN